MTCCSQAGTSGSGCCPSLVRSWRRCSPRTVCPRRRPSPPCPPRTSHTPPRRLSCRCLANRPCTRCRRWKRGLQRVTTRVGMGVGVKSSRLSLAHCRFPPTEGVQATRGCLQTPQSLTQRGESRLYSPGPDGGRGQEKRTTRCGSQSPWCQQGDQGRLCGLFAYRGCSARSTSCSLSS